MACPGPPECYGMHMGHPCPECMEDPGLASMDRIMAIASGVINDVDGYGFDTPWQSVREYLMHAELSKR